MANRISRALPIIISPSQGAFVHKRKIHDGILIANELIDSRTRATKKGAIFKNELQKAYDHVNWNFVPYMLGRIGFVSRW